MTSPRTAPAATGHTLRDPAGFLLALENPGDATASKVGILASEYIAGNTHSQDYVFSTWQSGLDLRGLLSGSFHPVFGGWLCAYETV